MQRFLLVPLLLIGYCAGAQSPNAYGIFHPDKARILFHDKVDQQQERLKGLDGKKDDAITLSSDETINGQIYYSLITRVDQIQAKIESDSVFSGQIKVKYIRALEAMLAGYNNNVLKRDYPATLAPELVDAFGEAMELDIKGESIEPVVRAHTYGVGKILVECFTFFPENKGVKPSRPLLVEKYLGLHPTEIFTVLKNNIDLPSADSLIKIAAHSNPNKFYDYAAAGDPLATRIRSLQDPFVHTIARMATSRSGRLYFPFIDLLIHDKITLDD